MTPVAPVVAARAQFLLVKLNRVDIYTIELTAHFFDEALRVPFYKNWLCLSFMCHSYQYSSSEADLQSCHRFESDASTESEPKGCSEHLVMPVFSRNQNVMDARRKFRQGKLRHFKDSHDL